MKIDCKRCTNCDIKNDTCKVHGIDPHNAVNACAANGFADYKVIAPLGLNGLAAEVHQNAVNHGWWEEERTVPEILMLCVSELAEALEEYRNNTPPIYYPCNSTKRVCCEDDGSGEHCASRPYNPEKPQAPCSIKSKKPEGVAVELADCIIRILDYCGAAGIDIEQAIKIKHEYNKNRPYRHGGKKC